MGQQEGRVPEARFKKEVGGTLTSSHSETCKSSKIKQK
jgi:hypothetical protein